MLILRPRGTPTEEERQAGYDAIAADPRIPHGALVVLDMGRLDALGSLKEVERRARILVARLGPKLGPVCAVIVPPRMALEAQHFQALSDHLGLRVAVFHDEPEALQWIDRYG